MTIIDQWHFGITVADLDASITFYRDGLGMSLRHRQRQANSYTARMLGYESCEIEIAQMSAEKADGRSGHVIELIEFLSPAGIVEESPMHRIGTMHVALLVNDIDDMVDRAVKHGATPNSEVLAITAGINEGGRVVWLKDPDGIRIELVQPRPAEINHRAQHDKEPSE